ncbi:hypothetical protein [Amnibacterium kyonggiense]|uniref:Transcriptional regulator, AbiEi antitoxin, Type IV TA system n=1 Tax=Amnibacterium kyonggiense TaxID=595671 RepID=A0A4R7FHW0_9MICO|nr:hypothetical protein [Amnibacterium kyonggiense]TDS74977.1 hypothetical protein CLV52_3501 [Amnibacterium kyonggiense]
MDPWTTPLIVVRGASHTAAERRSIARDCERGLLIRVRQGVYVATADWDAGTGVERDLARHVVRARALDAVAPWRPLFSHWTAAVLAGLPTMDAQLDRVHVTTTDPRRRGLDGVLTHAFPVQREEVRMLGGLLVTSVPRTVVDVAGGSPFLGGVVTADAALHRGVPRDLLEAAVDLAGPRRASGRIADVVAIAHPGAESAAESASYVSMFRLGFEPPELQHEVWDEQGLAGIADSYDRRSRIGAEVDGLAKYLDPRMAVDGTGMALVQEKRREDRMRAGLRGLARYGYWDAKDPSRLRPILAKVGLRPPQHRPTLADWAATARIARPRALR